MDRFDRSEAGSALILAFITIIVLAGTSAALLHTSTHRNREAAFSRDQGKAFYIAESGVSAGMAELTAEHDYDGDGLGDVSGAMDSGTYAVEATPLGGDIWTLRSVGMYGLEIRGIEAVISRRVTNPFKGAAFGGTSVSVGGDSMVDSYDSDNGTYASQVSGGHAGDNGGVGSNGDISADGNAEVYGDATPGPYGTVSMSGNSYIDGSTAPAPEETVIEPYVYTPVGVSLGKLDSTTTLASGTYRYSEIKFASSDVLTLGTNPGDKVTLYVDGDISITAFAKIVVTDGTTVVMHHGSGTVNLSGHGLVNTSETPSDFIFYSATTGDIKVEGTSDFYGAVYAPAASVRIAGTSGFFGAAVGDTVTIIGTGDVHYDEALGRIQITSRIRYQVNAWREFRP